MKLQQSNKSKGSVLIVTILTLAILTFLCATSLYVASQNMNSGMQTSSWQQSLTGSETGIDLAIRALNVTSTSPSVAWTGWKSVPLPAGSPLPASEPTSYANASPAPVGPPDATHYNYLPSTSSTSSLTVGNTEGANAVSSWVTIDTAGMPPTEDTNGKQWYRVRSTGQAAVSGPARASGNKLDNSLRNTIGLMLNRKGGTFLGPTRTVEVILQPLSGGGWVRGLTLNNSVIISGSGSVDSFNSTLSSASTNGQYDPAHRLLHGDIGSAHTGNSSISGSAHIYGSLAYSGAAVTGANQTTVSGTISTPFNATFTGTFDPVAGNGNSGWNWTDTTPSAAPSATPYSWNTPSTTTYTGGGGPPKDPNNGNALVMSLAAGTTTVPAFYIINGDFTQNSNTPFHITNGTGNKNIPNLVVVWVKGKFTTSGSSQVIQDSGTHIVWIVDNDITTSGSSYGNADGLAKNTVFVSVSGTQNANGTWPHQNKVTISGTSNFVGQIIAPGADLTISGGGSVIGAAIANSANISGGSGFHYDEALNTGLQPSIGNYAFASWFEDNSAPGRSITY